MKRGFKFTEIKEATFEAEVKSFKGGGAYIPTSQILVGRKVIVTVLPETKEKV